MVGFIHTRAPKTFEEWLSSHFWWTPSFETIGPEFPSKRAAALDRKGLQFIRDVWNHETNNFKPSEEVGETFGFSQDEYGYWATLCRHLLVLGNRLLIGRSNRISGDEWVGIYDSPNDIKPTCVLQGGSIVSIQHVDEKKVVTLLAEAWTYSVMPNSNILAPTRNGRGTRLIQGFMDKARVVEMIRSPKKRKILLFYGRIKDLRWDPDMYS
jgi:hypothetical protein